MSEIPVIPVTLPITAAVRRLAGFPIFQQLVLDGWIGTDADRSLASPEEILSAAWLFQGLDDEGRPYRDPEGSSTSVVVLSERADWAIPNRHNTAAFPQLRMLVYTDCSRDADGGVLMEDATNKCLYVFGQLNRCFHLPQNTLADQMWPGLRVHRSVAASGMEVQEVPGTNSHTVRGERTYELTCD